MSQHIITPKSVALQFLRAGNRRGALPIAYVSAVAISDDGRKSDQRWHTCTIREMSIWLTSHGFTWRPGSNGIWDAPA